MSDGDKQLASSKTIYMDEVTKRIPKILVVEDEDFNRSLLVRHLNREGFSHVDEAANGEEALEQLRKEDYDLVLTDLQMPVMDGLELLKSIKYDLRMNVVPVVVVSAMEEIDSIARSIELGAEDHLPKPFEPMILRARVLACLEKKRLRDREKTYLSEIRNEKKKVDELLNIILPTAVARELKKYGYVQPRRYDNVAILFCDIVGFTSYCDQHLPEEVISKLQTIFELFEEVMVKYNMEKIKTIGDEFMAASGLTNMDAEPFLTVVNAALDLIKAAEESDTGWKVRVGVHCGQVVAGVVGTMKYQYDVWGDTVNIASRMTSQAAPGTVAFLYDFWPDLQYEYAARMLGKRELKGKGEIEIVECYGRTSE
ncbi:MAG: adenylate/guanylate cyclase domain-containing protein [Alphaproteobacteria bacterium]